MCHNKRVDLSVAETLNSIKKIINPKTYKLLNINTKKRPLGCRKRPTLTNRVVFFMFISEYIFSENFNKCG